MASRSRGLSAQQRCYIIQRVFGRPPETAANMAGYSRHRSASEIRFLAREMERNPRVQMAIKAERDKATAKYLARASRRASLPRETAPPPT